MIRRKFLGAILGAAAAPKVLNPFSLSTGNIVNSSPMTIDALRRARLELQAMRPKFDGSELWMIMPASRLQLVEGDVLHFQTVDNALAEVVHFDGQKFVSVTEESFG